MFIMYCIIWPTLSAIGEISQTFANVRWKGGR